jgi:hypothetical protein
MLVRFLITVFSHFFWIIKSKFNIAQVELSLEYGNCINQSEFFSTFLIDEGNSSLGES